jgi:hypothetical protein
MAMKKLNLLKMAAVSAFAASQVNCVGNPQINTEIEIAEPAAVEYKLSAAETAKALALADSTYAKMVFDSNAEMTRDCKTLESMTKREKRARVVDCVKSNRGVKSKHNYSMGL